MMTTMTEHGTPGQSEPTPLAFPPIPLLSGDTFTAEDGAAHTVESITVVITAADGTKREVPLDSRFGGWWAPQAGPMS